MNEMKPLGFGPDNDSVMVGLALYVLQLHSESTYCTAVGRLDANQAVNYLLKIELLNGNIPAIVNLFIP